MRDELCRGHHKGVLSFKLKHGATKGSLARMEKETAIRYMEHCIKLAVRRPDPNWPIFLAERSINNGTWKRRRQILDWAERSLSQKDILEDPERYERSENPVVKQGWLLKNKVEKDFRNKLAGKDISLLIHVPTEVDSPAGYSLFNNFAEAFDFVGIKANIINSGESTREKLEEFEPSILLASDYAVFLENIDWGAVREYRKNNQLLIGLTASLAEYGNTPLTERLDWAKKHSVDFYYSYRDEEYVRTRKEYRTFFQNDYKILLLKFGANPLIHYPIPNMERDINFAYLASQHWTRGPRYYEFMRRILVKYPGFIDGPGWTHVRDFRFNRSRDRYIYARAKVGLNMHMQGQIDWACELNERVYILAACGIPQVTDHPALLDKAFSENALFVANTPKEYFDYFEEIVNNPKEGESRALRAQKETFAKYTTLHSVENFINSLEKEILR